MMTVQRQYFTWISQIWADMSALEAMATRKKQKLWIIVVSTLALRATKSSKTKPIIIKTISPSDSPRPSHWPLMATNTTSRWWRETPGPALLPKAVDWATWSEWWMRLLSWSSLPNRLSSPTRATKAPRAPERILTAETTKSKGWTTCSSMQMEMAVQRVGNL